MKLLLFPMMTNGTEFHQFHRLRFSKSESEGKICLSMEYYWNKLMKKFKMNENETEDSPIKTKLKRSECPTTPDETLKTNYLQIIGSIIYGFTHCRLVLAFPVKQRYEGIIPSLYHW